MDIDTINRSELARATGIDVAHISRIFSGKANPSLALAVRIAEHLEISLDELSGALSQCKPPRNRSRVG